ncbi:MAG: SWIM zinc finger family protein [Thermostichus sp. BF3_bins_97]
MAHPSLSEALIRQNTDPQVLERARRLASDGSILQLYERGDQIQAQVQGSELDPYEVLLTLRPQVEAKCTCPYDHGGWCKHSAAVALSYLHHPREIERRPSVEDLLQPLNTEQLRHLLQTLLKKQPQLIRQVERWVAPVVPKVAQGVGATVDPRPYRQHMQELLQETLQAWSYGEEGDPLQEGLPELLKPVQTFLAQEDPENALVILNAITEAWVSRAEELYDFGGDPWGVLHPLEYFWTKAILLGNPDPDRRISLQIQLEEWGSLLGQEFEMTAAALRQGWDDPTLVAVLAGDSDDLSGLWEDMDPPDYASDLMQLRLQILDQQRRQQEYLRLAEASHRWEHALVMRVKMGQIEQVMGSLSRLSFWTEAFAVAKALKEQGSPTQALEVAQYGLRLPAGHWDNPAAEEPDRYPLATWAVEVALALGEAAVALACQIVAFKARPSLEEYRRTESLAGPNWGSLKSQLLKFLKNNRNWRYTDDKTRIFLAEEKIEWAMASLQGSSSVHLVQQVMQAALATQPEWVLQQSRRRAEPIMRGRKSELYEEAAEWLTYTRAAYRMLNREADWQAYRAQVHSAHGRQHKLMGLLEKKEL